MNETEWAIRVHDLRKTYRGRRARRGAGAPPAVDGLELQVPRGGVHGFLGPNGSGKTSTIRMLLGLITPDAGSMEIFEHRVPDRLESVIDRVGAIVEQPRFFGPFSGIKNLTLLARAIDAPRARVDAVLAEVGLAERGGDRFDRYSLGMKQRLAIAATLLKDPDLLIFDEPTNGLDPAGIHEIRATMRGLADRGKTVLVSSHILSEVAQVADTVSIIGRGRLLAQGPVQEILSSHAQESVLIGIDELRPAARLLQQHGYDVSLVDHRIEVSGPERLDPRAINQLLATNGFYLGELGLVRADLESVFLELTAGEHLGSRPPAEPLPTPRHAAAGDPEGRS